MPVLTDNCTAFHFFLVIWELYYSPEAVEEYGETYG